LTIQTEKPAGQYRRHCDFLGQDGAVLVEFALLASVLFLIMFGIAQFGLALNQYIMLWNGVNLGATQFAECACDETGVTPYTTAVSTIKGAALGLTPASLTITLAVSSDGTTWTACASDAACQSALSAGKQAMVTATYPCNLKIMQYNFFPGCTLTAQVTEFVQ
jgi:Flp pilus assembly protein TadG